MPKTKLVYTVNQAKAAGKEDYSSTDVTGISSYVKSTVVFIKRFFSEDFCHPINLFEQYVEKVRIPQSVLDHRHYALSCQCARLRVVDFNQSALAKSLIRPHAIGKSNTRCQFADVGTAFSPRSSQYSIKGLSSARKELMKRA